MQSLRSRLILSHMLLVLIISPLIALAFIYLIETQIILRGVAADLRQQGQLIAHLATVETSLWMQPEQARLFIARFSSPLDAEIMLITPSRELLASSDPGDSDQIGQPLTLSHFPNTSINEEVVRINYSQQLQAEVVEVILPVNNSQRQIVGLIRLTQQLDDVYHLFVRLRYLVGGIVLAQLIVALLLSLFLSRQLERPLKQVTGAITGMVQGQTWQTLPEAGPQETQLLARAFNTLTGRLRSLEEFRRRLLANLVHEVGRPVGALQAAIQALLSGGDQDEAFRRELLLGMEAEVQRVHPLLDNLTRLHDQILGTLELDRQPTDLNTWLPEVIIPWQATAQEKDLLWQADIAEALPVLSIDQDRLARVLGNLLSNAIKYTEPGGQVSFAAASDGESVCFQVSDTGIGISDEEQAHIFEAFYRSHPGRRFPQGMGLGLSIAKELVTAHGGRIELESTAGSGSQFIVWLPETL